MVEQKLTIRVDRKASLGPSILGEKPSSYQKELKRKGYGLEKEVEN